MSHSVPLTVILVETRLIQKLLSEMGCHCNKTLKYMALAFRLGNGRTCKGTEDIVSRSLMDIQETVGDA